MGWKEEHGIGYEIPAFLEFLASKDIVEDQSWHNDACPRFGLCDVDADREVVLWIDHPLGSQREAGPEGKRFIAQIGPSCSEADKSIETDDLETALGAFFQKLAEFNKGKGKWAKPLEYLSELKEEYTKSLDAKVQADNPEKFVRDFYTWMEPVSDVNKETGDMVRRARKLIKGMKG